MVRDTTGFWNRQNLIATASDLTSTQKLLLYVLSNITGSNADCWPSVETISQQTALNVKSVRKGIRELAELGVLFVIVGGGRRSSRYVINVDSLAGFTPSEIGRGAESGSAETVPRTGAESGRADLPEVGSAGVPKLGDELPINNHLTPKEPANADGKNLSAGQKPETATEAWNSIVQATKKFSPLHEADMLRTLVSFQARRAARAVGGMTAIAGRDRYTATKMRVAFVEAFEGGMKVGVGAG